MFIIDWFRLPKRRRRGKRAASACARHLSIEPLETRRLLAVTIKGEITVANLPCATADVPVAGAMVTATCTVGAKTEIKSGWTDKNGDYSIKLTSAGLGDTVNLKVEATSQQTVGKPPVPAYVEMDLTKKNILSQDIDDPSHNLTLDYDADPNIAAAFAAFSMMQMCDDTARKGLKAAVNAPVTVVPLPLGTKGAYSRYFSANALRPVGFPPGGALIVLKLDDVANKPDTVTHEYGHHIAAMGGFLNAVGGLHELDENLRTRKQDPPYDAVLRGDSAVTGFEEGWADYVAAVAPSVVDTAWLHIHDLADSCMFSYDAAQTGGWAEDNEVSLMRIFYQITEKGNPQRYLTPATLYDKLSQNHINSLSQFWALSIPTGPASTLTDYRNAAARAEAYTVNGVGPTSVSATYGAGAAPPKIQVNFSVPNLHVWNGTASQYVNVPTFESGEVIFFDVKPDANGAPVIEIDEKGSLSSLTPVSDPQNRFTTYTYVLSEAERLKLQRAAPTQYWVLVKTSAPISSGGDSGPYWSKLVKLNLPALPAAGKKVSATEDSSFTAPVAWVGDLDSSDEADLTAAVSWGDGTSDSTQYSQANGGITFATDANGIVTATVNGTHTYADAGNDAVRTAFFFDGQEIALVDSKATVADAALTLTPLSGLTATEGTPVSCELATLSDASGCLNEAYSATIAWGDGCTTPATVGSDGAIESGGFHTYAQSGAKTVTITVADPDGAAASTVATIQVAETQLSGHFGWGNDGLVPADLNFNGLVATFVDPAGADALAAYSVAVTVWSPYDDPVSVPSQVVYDADRQEFLVYAQAVLPDPADDYISTEVTHAGYPPASIHQALISQSDFMVPVTDMGSEHIDATEGQSFTGTLATFNDSANSDRSAKIFWGDDPNADESCQIVSDGDGAYHVVGTHTYAQAGRYAPVIEISPYGEDARYIVQATIDVADASLHASSIASLQVTENTQFSGNIATCTDDNPAAMQNPNAASYIAKVQWESGHESMACVGRERYCRRAFHKIDKNIDSEKAPIYNNGC